MGGGGGGRGGEQMKRRHRKTKTDHWHASWTKKEDHSEGRHERMERGVTSARQQHSIQCTRTLARLKRANSSHFLWPLSKFLSYGHTLHFLWPQYKILMTTPHISYAQPKPLSYDHNLHFLWPQSIFLWPHFTFLFMATVHISYGQDYTST